MTNLRILHDNAAERATITATSQASTAMAAANLKTYIKGEIWRSVGTSATLTLTWADPQTIAGIVLPYFNGTGAATIRAIGRTNAADASPLFDVGPVDACPGQILGLWDWGDAALGANAFAYGGGSCAVMWLPVPGAVRKLEIVLSDPGNAAGYLEAGLVMCGGYWEPGVNADYGAMTVPVDSTKVERSDAGDQIVDRGTRHNKLSFSLSSMDPVDRAAVWRILRGNGASRPVFIDMYPDSTDEALRQENMLAGRLTNLAGVTAASFMRATTSVTIEGL